MSVKALSPEDWKITRELRLAALLNSPEAFGGTYAQSLERTEQQWREWPANGQPFAAFVDDVPVGIACGVAHPDDPQKTYLISMWVSPEARGKQVGKTLIDAVTGWARARGSSLLELDVYEANEPAYRAYIKAGFTVVGPCPDHAGALTMHFQIDTPGSE